MKTKIKFVSMTLKVALLGMMAFAFAACDSGKEAWEFTDLSKAEFEALQSDCNNRKEGACEKLSKITINKNFCDKLLAEKINENNYYLAANCYYSMGLDNSPKSEEALNQALKYYEKACERKNERKNTISCIRAAGFYDGIYFDSEYSAKERFSAFVKRGELYDKACDWSKDDKNTCYLEVCENACEKGIKQGLAREKERLPEIKKYGRKRDCLRLKSIVALRRMN